jgi:hypothetical protein
MAYPSDNGLCVRGGWDWGSRAAGEQSSENRLSRLSEGTLLAGARVSPGIARLGLCRGTEHHHRLPLGGRQGGSSPCAGRRVGPVEGRSHRGPPVVQAAKNATTTIPIVMMSAADPVGNGFVASLARPGGNITGSSSMLPELAGKRLELLREVLPKLSRIDLPGLWRRSRAQTVCAGSAGGS